MTRKDLLQDIKKQGLISDQVDADELATILEQLHTTNNLQGDVVEFGCYTGTTSLYLQRHLNGNGELYVYDSFEGLPDKAVEDESPAGLQFKTGELLATKKQFIQNFKKASLPLPHIKKGWFNEVVQSEVPEKIRFAFLDGDYFESVLTPLKLIEDKLVDGAIIVVDDYMNEALPGAAKAVQVWAKDKNVSVRGEHSLAVIRRQ